ncbi:SusC/RagA family TonB-linked outer membrane protein [Longitalea arenae]|uniref:SusC/RagA family TonB-linked outer membrane protein n=1 Tax=Longitalea arenae TaxID=2812558 RepID=UPI001F086D48|nr:SusC/RagA family TonB-linked outer membrane protein [Longitalea arenae]
MTKATIRLLLIMLAGIWGLTGTAQEKKMITGVVKDSAGKALPGVSVSEKGSSSATVTDMNGMFRVQVSTPNPVLVFTSIGFDRKEIAVGSQTSLDVSLSGEVTSLEGVVVTALGIKKDQRKLGYATTQVLGKDIVQSAPTNFGSALYGKAPGVTINTNPGGATSAVGIQIRGVNSINYQRQPLLVVDGVVTRNGDANSEGYWGGNQRLNGNGLLDINPENIESINILKGAAASALYGSDANFGVIVITTKNGKGRKGLGIEVNLSGNVENVAVTPDLQTSWGPGYERTVNIASFGADDKGWLYNANGDRYPIFRAWAQYGPKLDNGQVYWWDGQMREYKAQSNNWKEFYRTGHSEIANIAVSNSSEKMNYRFSYTRNNYKGIQIGGKQEKNTFNFNSTYKLNNKVSIDLVASYVNEKVHNRPRQLFYVTNNFGGFFSPAEYMDVLFDKYKTSKGYKWVPFNSNVDVDERIKYNIRATDFLDFLWNQLANSFDETSNRFLASATVNYNIAKGLNFRGRYGTDYTGYFAENKERSTQPISFGATGRYSTNTNRFVFNYGDVLLTYERNITDDLKATASIGYQGRREEYRYNEASTRDGLSQENWFSLNASKGNATGSARRTVLVKDGMFGMLNLEYKDFLFVEGTLRRERTSSLAPGNNTFYYPGVSAALELNNAFELPEFVSYSKLRAAYGVVGNPPDAYVGNVLYFANPISNIEGIPILYPPTEKYGNKELRNEMKKEMEFGWENRFFNNRLGFDLTYYNNKIIDQITALTTPASIGATSVIVNVGNMRNYGVELGLFGTPVKTRDFAWDTRLNMAFNRNKVVSLKEGLESIQLGSVDNGALLVIAQPGRPAGDLMAYKRKTDDKGNFIVNAAGFYEVDYSKQQVVGNLQPKVNGGFINSFTYKNFNLNVVVDFRFGGQLVSPTWLYGTGAGMYNNTLFGRDAEHGGLSYYYEVDVPDANGKYSNGNIKPENKKIGIATGSAKGPQNQRVFDDGMILKGVTADGKENTTIVETPAYYRSRYAWGSGPNAQNYSSYQDAIFNNDFIKMREITLSYTLPRKVAGFIKAQNLTFTVFGRNLFYFSKDLPYYDPEEGVGTNWVSQGSTNGSGNAATRSIGGSLRVSF